LKKKPRSNVTFRLVFADFLDVSGLLSGLTWSNDNIVRVKCQLTAQTYFLMTSKYPSKFSRKVNDFLFGIFARSRMFTRDFRLVNKNLSEAVKLLM
jgi:hypothetical protein